MFFDKSDRKSYIRLMIREKVRRVVLQAFDELKKDFGDFLLEEIPIEHPENPEHGDYATSVAFALAKELKRKPNELAELLVSKFNPPTGGQNSKFLDKVQAVGGFVNFYISKEYLLQELLRAVREKKDYGGGAVLKNKRVMVEFTDPNPFKEFHIGHLYSNIVGEALSRLLEALGALVKRANYQGDVGLHVAKAVWAMQKMDVAALARKPIKDRVQALGQAYAQGNKAYETDPKAKQEIVELNKKIFAKDKEIRSLYEKGRKWSLQKFEEIYQRLGTKFDYYYFESDAGKKGLDIVRKNLKKGVFQESKGAIIFPGEKYGLHKRVFINSQGLPTYEAKELGLAPTKYKDFTYDLSLIVTGNEIIEYFKVLLAALKQIYPALAEKTIHISHGMVRLPEGKMSSRTGKVVTGEELIDEVKERARKLAGAYDSALSAKEKEDVAEKVALAAIKYSLLRVTLGRDIIFDFEKSLSLEGDSGPYLQYTYARCRSIARKAGIFNFQFSISKQIQNFSKEELAILRIIYRFPEVVQEAAEKYAPNLVCSFAFDLAQKYNQFYNTHPVLQADTKEQKEFRLALTAACAQLLKNSLYLLGIHPLERM